MYHPVPKNHLTQIGDITVSFALLESQIQSLIGSLVHEHQRVGQILTAELSFKNLRALAVSLYIERHGKDQDYLILRDLIIKCSRLEDKRNQVTHSIWASGKDIDHITRIKTTAKEKQGLQFKFEDVSVNDLSRIASDIRQVAMETQQFYLRLISSGKAINSPINKIW